MLLPLKKNLWTVPLKEQEKNYIEANFFMHRLVSGFSQMPYLQLNFKGLSFIHSTTPTGYIFFPGNPKAI